MNRLLRLFVWLSCVGILRTKMGLALWLNPVIRCTMRRRLLCGTFETLGLRCPNGASGPNRTFMTFAANGSLEPIVQSAASCLHGWFGQEADVEGKTGLSFRMLPRVPCLKLETVLSWMQMRP